MSGQAPDARRAAPGGEHVADAEGQAAGSRGDTSSSGDAESVFYCDLCGSVMLNLHCKLICERCGYKRDCSDP